MASSSTWIACRSRCISNAAAAALQQVRHFNKSCGLVGYPNVGKSTTFNAIIGAQLAEAANFPFCTIEPNISKASVPDPLLDELAKVEGSARKVPGQLEVRDIAGLVKGASEGQGMGNSFLANIRHVHCIIQVVRCFSDSKIAHVDDPVNIDPVSEFEAISDELLIADIEMVTRKMPSLRKRACAEPEAKKMLPLYETWLKGLEEGVPVRNILDTDKLMETFGARVTTVMLTDPLLCVLITAKPILVMANVLPEDVKSGNEHTEALQKHVGEKCPRGVELVVASSILEEETSSLGGDAAFLAEYLSSYGLTEPRLPRMMEKVKGLLGVSHYYTLGSEEARAWFIQKGEKAPAAARYVHSDFEKFFLTAKQCRPEEVLKRGGLAGVRDAGLIRNRGKDYVVQEGDILEFIDRGHH
ncbi:GTP-dependent nucleic acid-binding protein engD, putative [Perkinsus marinus ATCC 50983]|uniref:GTP-dependent nucleic acid-binding protein engD, putative n=1 Tax=Perkinsus marinus (strain ATCC 50983 / TXsc) TaxID=423536 RepID=C5LL77_PERM5|nr:GTP-dependent nucleic acid-binding protein engD, putative [Perkinsus marinus ATCC 50983]EER02494.1 GTP-dependent nucleic acid-binding protein engD, putative [Perkinsus marinus ATCC 50983]|eukprot:XP_002769776.1 GTP-dependent nucleic acid-binding protein engD, putative [Perkinsus marinus ATCC 50983]